jgi:hypothetical protein
MIEPAFKDIDLSGVLPDGFIAAMERSAESTDLQTKFKMIFRGLEKYELHKFIPEYELKYQDVLDDLMACLKCDGVKCITKTCGGERVASYLGFNTDAMEFYDKENPTPYIGLFLCPGWKERKEAIKRLWMAKPDGGKPEPVPFKPQTKQNRQYY